MPGSDHAAPETAPSAAAKPVLKPAPVRPPDQPGVVTDGSLPEKPLASPRIAASVLVPWTVSLAASQPSPWATTYTTLTATVNMDIGPTPYFLRIRDNETGAYLASCGSGTTCAVTVTRSNVDAVSFTAMVTDVQNPPLASASTTIHWHSAGVKLAVSATTVPVGGASTITAITDYDIASSPFYTEIYDDTTATFLQSCGAGTTCAVSVSQTAATTHRYRACFSGFGTSYPPPSILECTAVRYITWSSSGAAVSLTASSGTITATSSIDVGTTPYYIQIYDLAGSRIASCGTGTTCTTSFTAAWGGSYLLALVGPSSLTPNFAAVAASTVHGYFDLGNGGQGTPIGPGPHPAGPVGDPSFIANIVTGPAIQ